MTEELREQDIQPVPLLHEDELIVKEAVARHQNLLNIDSEKELLLFKKKIAWRHKKRRIVWSAAASVLLLICIGAGILFSWRTVDNNEPLIVYEAKESVSGPLLYMDGKEILLNSNVSLNTLGKLGAEVTEEGIKYSKEGDAMMNTIKTFYGQTYSITLSDGTLVQLNSNTTFTYPTYFDGAEREVELAGEAYFTVAKDAYHPFIVHTEEVQTKVLGTEFDVRAYGGEPSTVTLVKGCVEVTAGMRAPIVLKPGQSFSYTNSYTDVVEVEEVDVREYSEWRSGFFYFDNRTLFDVFRFLGRYYNINVESRNDIVMKQRFNLWIDMSKAIEENLKLINEVGGIHATIKDDKVIIK